MRVEPVPVPSAAAAAAAWKAAEEARAAARLQAARDAAAAARIERLSAARPLVKHPGRDYVSVCRARDSGPADDSEASESTTRAADPARIASGAAGGRRSGSSPIRALTPSAGRGRTPPSGGGRHSAEPAMPGVIARSLERSDRRDLVVAELELPDANAGRLVLPGGLDVPGRYALRYHLDGAVTETARSAVFEVEYPAVALDVPSEAEIGRPLAVRLSLANGGPGAAALRFAAEDWLGVYPRATGPGDPLACVWREAVEPWACEASFVVPALAPLRPGEYTMAYHLGRHSDHVAGSAPLRASFPRRSANRFDPLAVRRPPEAERREIRFLLALDGEDMGQELAALMTHGTFPFLLTQNIFRFL